MVTRYLSAAELEPCVSDTEMEPMGQNPSVLPPDILTYNFQSSDDIRNLMLTKADIATVISSYEKTIGTTIVCCVYASHSSCKPFVDDRGNSPTVPWFCLTVL